MIILLVQLMTKIYTRTKMKIDILCNDGSPMGVTLDDLYGEGSRIGVGGSEYALLTLAEAWHEKGNQVTIYNDPRNSYGSPWEHKPVSSFEPKESRDILIAFRAINPLFLLDEKSFKVWWSCDQYTRADADFRKYPKYVNKIVTISPRHTEYFSSTYMIQNSIPIDIPVRLNDLSEDIEKVSKKCIFTSVPDRGLQTLWEVWKVIKREVPEATLTITSDYRLWGADSLNEPHKIRWFMEDGVSFLGAVKRRQLIQEQLSSDLLTYPSNYDELFCVAVAEAQACGVYPVTSDTGSLPTTNMGKVIPSSNLKMEFANVVIDLLKDPNLKKLQAEIRKKAVERFNPERVISEWDEKVFNG